MCMAISKAISHEVLNALAFVHSIQSVQDQLAIYHHIEETGAHGPKTRTVQSIPKCQDIQAPLIHEEL